MVIGSKRKHRKEVMGKLYLRDIGSHPERDLEITFFKDGELQFEADNGKYVHINIAREGVSELIKFLLEETQLTKRAADECPTCAGLGFVNDSRGRRGVDCSDCNGSGIRR